MARTGTPAKAKAPASPAAPRKTGTELVEAIRSAMKLRDGRAAALEALGAELDARLVEEGEHQVALAAQSGTALLESADAYATNQAAIGAAAREVEHVKSLIQLVATARATAADEELDADVRRVCAVARTRIDAALATLPAYEKAARAIAGLLASHTTVGDSLEDVRRTLAGLVRDGKRTQAWADAMRLECLGDESDTNQLYVAPGKPLPAAVQLPSTTQVVAHWGNVRNEFWANAEHAVQVRAPRKDQESRPAGVYNADGKEIGNARQRGADIEPVAHTPSVGRKQMVTTPGVGGVTITT